MENEIFSWAGLTVEIALDEEPENPREYDPLGTLVLMEHGDFEGSKQEREDEINRIINLSDKSAIVLPVYRYEHSGIALSTSSFVGRAQHAEWDSGITGFVYVMRSDVRDIYKVKRITSKIREEVERELEQEVELYGKYLNGECYLVQVFDTGGTDYLESASVIGYYEAVKWGKEMAEEIVRYEEKGVA